ncbi:MAG: ferrous iron transport protein A [Gammaproteobacteria bacterium]|nr:ferrous iron transport protein A [Gammaproteobacteria bacterium]MBU1656407.1 ferrous iron transport protein A [Gammaproteobacteria bacterium]MBU1960955.1 ferrous iron transport protein A [Gammaproteobacteria bacterium]
MKPLSELRHNLRAPFPLSMAQEGERVRIFLLRGGNGLSMRLTSLGLNLGSELVVSQRQGGNLVVIRGETRLALGAGMAQKIMVTRHEH